jgi:predicted metal-dependent hydrolase
MHSTLSTSARVMWELNTSAIANHTVPNDPYGSHFINAMNVLFPPGERGFIRVLKQTLPFITYQELRDRVAVFIQQEAQHARAHSVALRQSTPPGIFTNHATRFAEASIRLMFGCKAARSHPVLVMRVATVAAVEHLTAELGRWAFEDARFTELGCDPVAVKLIKWHCAEEVEHRAVAFDVLVALAPRHHRLLRSALMLFWMPAFFIMWLSCSQALLLDDKAVKKRALTPARLRRSAQSGAIPSLVSLMAHIRPFFAKSFHPDSMVSPATEAACAAHLAQI